MAGKISCGSTVFSGTFIPEDGAGEPGFRISAGSRFFDFCYFMDEIKKGKSRSQLFHNLIAL